MQDLDIKIQPEPGGSAPDFLKPPVRIRHPEDVIYLIFIEILTSSFDRSGPTTAFREDP